MTQNGKGFSVKAITELSINADQKPPENKHNVKELVDLYQKYEICDSIITNNNNIIAGYDIVEAARQIGKKEIGTYEAALNQKNEIFCTLEIACFKKRIDPIAISKLISYALGIGITRRELCKILKKSKSWLSKYESLAKDLSEKVYDLVQNGIIDPYAAMFISKLANNIQQEFAIKAKDNCLNIEEIKYLVKSINSMDGNSEKIKSVLDNLDQLLLQKKKKIIKKKTIESDDKKMSNRITLLINVMDNFMKQFSNHDKYTAEGINQIKELANKTDDLSKFIKKIIGNKR